MVRKTSVAAGVGWGLNEGKGPNSHVGVGYSSRRIGSGVGRLSKEGANGEFGATVMHAVGPDGDR